jgi:hypothetical protein
MQGNPYKNRSVIIEKVLLVEFYRFGTLRFPQFLRLFLSMLYDITTCVVSGFGGMRDRFDPIIPPNRIADISRGWISIG